MKRSHILLFGAIALWSCMDTIGCGKGKGIEPPPVVEPTRISTFHATFSWESGAVFLEWSLAKRDSIREIKIERKSETEAYQIIGRLIPEANTPIIMSFKDTAPLSAENYTYRIVVVRLDKRVQLSNTIKVLIPGAKFVDVTSDHLTATINLVWEADRAKHNASHDIASVEVIRKSGLSEDHVFRSTASGRNTFADKTIRGNTLYTYFLRTVMKNGVSLNSREILSGIYLETDVQQLRGLLGTTRIATDYVGSIPSKPLVKTLKDHELTLIRYEFGQSHLWVRQVPLVLNLDGYRLASISTDGPASFQITPLFLLSAIQAPTSTLEMSAFAYQIVDRKPILKPIDIPIKPWSVSPNAQQTLITFGTSGNIYVFGDDRIQVYDHQYREQGTFHTEMQTNPYDLLAVNYTLWMSYPDEGALVTGQVEANAQNIMWSNIEFETTRHPTGLAMNIHNQICILDAHNKEVLVFDQNGQLVVTIGNISGDFYAQNRWGGDIDAASYKDSNGIYVLDSTGRLTFLETPPNYR